MSFQFDFETSRHPWRPLDWALVALIVTWGAVWHLPHLTHSFIHNWDESMHQVVSRGVYDTFFYPHMYVDPIYPVTDHSKWWYADAWLLKPTGPFWVNAVMMKVVGVTPAASRLTALLGELLAALSLFALLRPQARRFWATVGALGFLAVPYSWTLIQGHMFGDVTDTTLVGWVTFAVLCLVWAVERHSWRWAFAAGVATGVGYLCKTQLALAPLGVFGVMWLLGLVAFSPGPRLRHVLAMYGGFFAAALPWNLYCAYAWPKTWNAMNAYTLGHFGKDTGTDIGSWARPADAIFNEVNQLELAPLPVAVAALTVGWLFWRALTKKDPLSVALFLWLGSTWFVHSVAHAKQPNHVWNSAPAVFAALALWGKDVWRAPRLAAAAIGAFATPLGIAHLPQLAKWREALPAVLDETRRLPGLFEGLALAVGGVGVVSVLLFVPFLRRWLAPLLAFVANALVLHVLLWAAPTALITQRDSKAQERHHSHTKDVGLALDAALPKKSVLWADLDADPPSAHLHYDLMFWSGRMTYRRGPDLPAAQAKGYESFLVTPAAAPFEPIVQVPAHAWLRAYDLSKPAALPDVPQGAERLEVKQGSLTVLGFGAAPVAATRDRWAFFVRPQGVPHELRVGFVTATGTETVVVSPEASLVGRGRLADVAWFVMPVVGPPRAAVTALELDPAAPTKLSAAPR